MENASKALVIAGAILISILLVSVGIMIFSGASGIFNQGRNALSGQELELFNSQFTIYEGNMSGSQIQSLLAKVIASNASNSTQEVKVSGQKVTSKTACSVYPASATYNATNKTISGTASNQTIVSMQSYKVYCHTTNGIVDNIIVQFAQ